MLCVCCGAAMQKHQRGGGCHAKKRLARRDCDRLDPHALIEAITIPTSQPFFRMTSAPALMLLHSSAAADAQHKLTLITVTYVQQCNQTRVAVAGCARRM